MGKETGPADIEGRAFQAEEIARPRPWGGLGPGDLRNRKEARGGLIGDTEKVRFEKSGGPFPTGAVALGLCSHPQIFTQLLLDIGCFQVPELKDE